MKKEFTKAQLQDSFDDGIDAGKVGLEALLRQVNEQHAKAIEQLNQLIEDMKDAHVGKLRKFQDQLDEQTKKVEEINKVATDQIKALQSRCQELAACIRLLARQL